MSALEHLRQGLSFLPADLLLLRPQLLLALFGVGILLTDFLIEPGQKAYNAGMAMLGVFFAGFSLWQVHGEVGGQQAKVVFQQSLLVDDFALFFGLIFLAAAALVILLSVRYFDVEHEQHGEYYALILFATIGMLFMVEGFDLLVQFMGLETMAISFYVLAGFLRGDRRSNEAAMKYVLLGAFSSGILAYGFSILYGLTNQTNLGAIADKLDELGEAHAAGFAPLLMLALVTIAAGLFFKVAAVPFHQWAPDVYEGAPTPITAFLSVASKTASFGLLLRLVFTTFLPAAEQWQWLLGAVAVASMTVGNLAALTQTNVKRLLAYSSISHAGYVLLGIVAAITGEGNETGLRAVAFYLFAYAFMNLGAFAVIIILRRKGLIGDTLDDLNGLITRSPAAAVLLLIFMLSLAGIPPTAGFIGKYYIFLALMETGHYYLAIFGALYVVPALYYYFRIVVHAFLRDSTDLVPTVVTAWQRIALSVAGIVVLVAGIYPEPFIRLASSSMASFVSFGH
jgi:NADH-quinone oxidoreductase subunit N